MDHETLQELVWLEPFGVLGAADVSRVRVHLATSCHACSIIDTAARAMALACADDRAVVTPTAALRRRILAEARRTRTRADG